MFKKIWVWLRDRVFHLPEDENSGGDVIRKHPAEMEIAVAYAVRATYGQVRNGGPGAIDRMAAKLLDSVVEPLPDWEEAILRAAAVTKVKGWVLQATAGMPSEAIVVARIMVILVGLP